MASTDHSDHGATGSATSRLDDAARSAKDTAGELWDDARQSARAALDQRKEAAAQGLHQVAGTLRSAAGQQRQDGASELASGLTGSAARQLERLSTTLREKDVGSMLRDVDRFAHRQPLAFFGLALAAGFATVRFLRASQDGGAPHDEHGSSGAATTLRTPQRSSSSVNPV